MSAAVPAGQADRMRRNLALKVMAHGASRVLRVLATALTARWLGPGPFGSLAAGTAIATMAADGSNFGIPVVLAQETARDQARAPALSGRLFRAKLLLLLMAAIPALVVSLAVEHSPLLGLLLFAGYGALSLADCIAAVLRGYLDFVAEAALSAAGSVSVFALVCLATWWTGSPLAFAGALCIAAFVALILGVVLLGRHTSVQALMREPPLPLARVVRELLPFAIPCATGIAFGNSDIVILSSFRTPEEVGAFAIALRCVTASQVLALAASEAVVPYFVRAQAQGRGQARALALRAVVLASVAGAGMAALIAFIGPSAIRVILGPQHVHSTPFLQLLCVALVGWYAYLMLSALALTLGLAKRVATWAIATTVTCAALELLLVPHFGASALCGVRIVDAAASVAFLSFLLFRHLGGPGGLPARSSS